MSEEDSTKVKKAGYFKPIIEFINVLISSKFDRFLAALVILIILSATLFYLAEIGQNPAVTSLSDALWWAVITVTTVGYGDKVPATEIGRIVGVGLAFSALIFAALLSGRLAALLVELQLKEGKGMKDLKDMKNHFVVCGWKTSMTQLLNELLAIDPDLQPEQIVLVNNIDIEKMNSLRSQEPYSRMKFIHGDFVEESVLRRAHVNFARRILIMADDAGEFSPAETDARTVMAVMTMTKTTRDAYICAELLDRKFEKHLRASGCDEIVMTRETSRMMLANASSGTGVAETFELLLSGETGNALITKQFDKSFIGKRFKDLKDHLMKQEGALVIGVVENTGNLLQRKREALKAAQKTPDISQLVKNLHSVKTIVANRPIINPKDDYILQGFSLAIFISPPEVDSAREETA
ncbi:MAG: NAD-binding protein [Candidatus Lindowbacteria bacterium]|nr:NAD-binding protein [Candidatus Lindowbacteria bacterium]